MRESDEFDDGHIGGATHMYVGHLMQHANELDLDRKRPVVVTCGADFSGIGSLDNLYYDVLGRRMYVALKTRF